MNQFFALVGILLTIGAGAWLLMSEPSSVALGIPLGERASVQAVGVSLPSIDSFDVYHPNHTNPFVPSGQRERERERRKRPIRNSTPPKGLTTPVPRPELDIPAIEERQTELPRPLGMVASAHVCLVLFEGDDGLRSVLVGEQVDGYTVRGIDGDEIVLVDADGQAFHTRIGIAESRENLVAMDDSQQSGGDDAGLVPELPITIDDKERDLIAEALKRHGMTRGDVERLAKDPAAAMAFLQTPKGRAILRDQTLRPLIQRYMRKQRRRR